MFKPHNLRHFAAFCCVIFFICTLTLSFSTLEASHYNLASFSKEIAENPSQKTAPKQVGIVLFVKGEAFVESQKGLRRPLTLKSPVFKGDVVNTSKKSLIQINFSDGSMVRLAGDGKMSIDAYLTRADGTADAQVGVSKGKFAILVKKISDVSKQDYRIHTTTATIGIRGTFGNGVVSQEKTSFSLAPERIDGQLVHSQALITQLKTGKETQIVSDSKVGNNAVSITAKSLVSKVSKVDMKSLSRDLGLPVSKDGSIPSQEVMTGKVSASFDLEKQKESQSEKSEEKSEKKEEKSEKKEKKSKEVQNKKNKAPKKDSEKEFAEGEDASEASSRQIEKRVDTSEEGTSLFESDTSSRDLQGPDEGGKGPQSLDPSSMSKEAMGELGVDPDAYESGGYGLKLRGLGVQGVEDFLIQEGIEEDFIEEEQGKESAFAPAAESVIVSTDSVSPEDLSADETFIQGNQKDYEAIFVEDYLRAVLEGDLGSYGHNPLEAILQEAREDFSLRFSQLLQVNDLSLSTSDGNVQDRMWEGLQSLFVPRLVEDYRKNLEALDDINQGEGSDLERLRIVEDLFKAEIPVLLDAFFEEHFVGAVNYYKNQTPYTFEPTPPQEPQEPAQTSRIHFSRSWEDFSSYDYSKSSEKIPNLLGDLALASDPLEGKFADTRKAPKSSSIGTLQGITGSLLVQKSIGNALMEDDLQRAKSSLEGLDTLYGQLDGQVGGNWSLLQEQDLQLLIDSFQESRSKVQQARTHFVKAYDSNRDFFDAIVTSYLDPLEASLDFDQDIYLGIDPTKQQELLSQMQLLQQRAQRLQSKIHAHVQAGEGVIPPQIEEGFALEIRQAVLDLNASLLAAKNALLEEDPLNDDLRHFMERHPLDAISLHLEEAFSGQLSNAEMNYGGLFQSYEVAARLLELEEDSQANFSQLFSTINASLTKLEAKDALQNHLGSQLSGLSTGFLGSTLDSIIDSAVVYEQQGEAFSISSQGIVNHDLLSFREDLTFLQGAMEASLEDGLSAESLGSKNFMLMQEGLNRLEAHYLALDARLALDHTLKTHTQGGSVLWEEMASFVSNDLPTYEQYVQDPTSLNDTQVADLVTKLENLNSLVVKPLADNSHGNALIDQALGVFESSQALPPALVHKGDFYVLASQEAYEDVNTQQNKKRRELGYLGHAFTFSEKVQQEGVKKFSSPSYSAYGLPEVPGALLARADDDEGSWSMHTRAVIQFGTTNTPLKGYALMSPKHQFEGDFSSAPGSLEVSELSENESFTLSADVLTSEYKVKSVEISQEDLTFVKEDQPILILERIGAPPSTDLDVVATEDVSGYQVQAIHIFGSQGEVKKGDALFTLSKPSETHLVSNESVRAQGLSYDGIGGSYQVKSLAIPQGDNSFVEQGETLMVLQHPLDQDIVIQAQYTGVYQGLGLEVGDTINNAQEVGSISIYEETSFSDIVLKAQFDGQFTDGTLSIGDEVDNTSDFGSIEIDQGTFFADLVVKAPKDGLYQGIGLVNEDVIDSPHNLGRVISTDLESVVAFSQQGSSLSLDQLFSQDGRMQELREDPRPLLVYYFDEGGVSGEESIYQMRGFQEVFQDDSNQLVNTEFMLDRGSELTTNPVEILGNLNKDRIDGMGLYSEGSGSDTHLVAAAFIEDRHDLIESRADTGHDVQVDPADLHWHYYGYMNGIQVQVDFATNTLQSWYLKESQLLSLSPSFSSDGNGKFYQSGAYENNLVKMDGGLTHWRLGKDGSSPNMVIDREHLIAVMDDSAIKTDPEGNTGLLVASVLPSFSVENDQGVSHLKKPDDVMWGSWDMSTYSYDEYLPGLHNFWVSGVVTEVSDYLAKESALVTANTPIASYETMAGLTLVVPDGSGAAQVTSQGGFGKLLVDFESDTWEGMNYFSNGYLLVGKGGLGSINMDKDSSSISAQGFTASGGWALVPLFDSYAEISSLASHQLTTGSGKDFEGMFSGTDAQSLVMGFSDDGSITLGESYGSSHILTGAAMGALSKVREDREEKNFVASTTGLFTADGSALTTDEMHLNFSTPILIPHSDAIGSGVLPDDLQARAAYLEDHPFLTESGQTHEKFNWVELRENFVALELPSSSFEIHDLLEQGSLVETGDVLAETLNGFSDTAEAQGIVYYYSGVDIGATVSGAYATLSTLEGGFSVNGSQETAHLAIVDGRGVLALKAVELSQDLLNNGSARQAQAILRNSLDIKNSLSGLDVSYTINVKDLIKQGDISLEVGDDIPFILRLFAEFGDQKFVLELPHQNYEDSAPFLDYSLDASNDQIVVYQALEGDTALDLESRRSTSYALAMSLDAWLSSQSSFASLGTGVSSEEVGLSLSAAKVTDMEFVFGGGVIPNGNVSSVTGEIYIDSISISNHQSSDSIWGVSDSFEQTLASPIESIYLDKQAYYLTPAGSQELERLLPSMSGYTPVDGTGFIVSIPGTEEFEYLTFGLWKSQYSDGNETVDAMGFFAGGDASSAYTRHDHNLYVDYLDSLNLVQEMTYYGKAMGAIVGPQRDGSLQVGHAQLKVNFQTGTTYGTIQYGMDRVDLQTGSLQEMGHFGSTHMGFKGSAELRLSGEAATGNDQLGSYEGYLFGKYDLHKKDAAQEAAGTYNATNAAGDHRAVGSFGVKK